MMSGRQPLVIAVQNKRNGPRKRKTAIVFGTKADLCTAVARLGAKMWWPGKAARQSCTWACMHHSRKSVCGLHKGGAI